ncbi:nucleolar protein 11 [Amyelois transitella]|uniref:nucleolar protein 11 n=1 Tax=Amyelois transitella TaxID=680683 RepID=UPI00298F7141|nr:nucleolar protein 11 [Amyelois transitella]
MAKLHNYYVLCPLIDQKSFLGVSKDKESEFVIVTLARNVVNKYRLSDQKQVGGWTSKEHITAPVIYDIDQDNYVGVFNNNTIKLWNKDSQNLDKIKKFKFPLNILKITPRESQTPLIIFCNGNCASLPYAIENRKTYEGKSLLKDGEEVIDSGCYSLGRTDHICYLVKEGADNYEIVSCPIRDELGDLDKSKLSRVKVARANVCVVGGLVSTSEKPSVFFLWSDSKLAVYDLIKKSWKTVGAVPWVSTVSAVSLAWMGKHHLILFGNNSEQDGAVIVVYNTMLGIGSCRYPMKMYSEGARLYCMNGRIVLEASNHIGMLPYVLETKRNLSNLLGSHEIVRDEQMEIAEWDSPAPNIESCKEIKELVSPGIAERAICSHVIPKLLENKNKLSSILYILKSIRDVPESVLVMLLHYGIKQMNPEELDVTDEKACAEFFVIRTKQKHFLNQILKLDFSDALLIPYLREGLSLNSTLFLLSYITCLLSNRDDHLSVEYESRLCDWCNLIMDAFYQHFLMTKDEKVARVLENTMRVCQHSVEQLLAIDELLPILHKVVSGNIMEEQEEKLSYAIEIMQI